MAMGSPTYLTRPRASGVWGGAHMFEPSGRLRFATIPGVPRLLAATSSPIKISTTPGAFAATEVFI